jgi:ribulose-phosphate 3-epimerase
MSAFITPSILSANMSNLQDEVDSIEPFSDGLHIDVMDGRFVPNSSPLTAQVMKGIQTDLPLNIHLMVEDPAGYVQDFLDIGAKNITFHAEAVDSAHRAGLIQAIRDGGAHAGIALNPDTPVSDIEDVIEDIDMVLIMSVHPGRAGQAFIPDVLTKVKDLRSRFGSLMIQMDGGVNADSAPLCRESGANNLVAASAIFGVPADQRAEVIRALRGTE